MHLHPPYNQGGGSGAAENCYGSSSQSAVRASANRRNNDGTRRRVGHKRRLVPFFPASFPPSRPDASLWFPDSARESTRSPTRAKISATARILRCECQKAW